MTRLLLVPLALALSTTAFATGDGSGGDGESFDNGKENAEDSNIVNGELSTQGQYPEVVQIRHSSGSCTASIVDPAGYWLLTAAHCIPEGFEGDEITAFVGIEPDSEILQSAQSEKIYVHSSYDWGGDANQGHDIAVIQLAEPLTGIVPMALNESDIDSSWYDLEVTHIGYGITSSSRSDSGTQRWGTVPIIEIGEDDYPDDANFADQVITFDGDQSTCQGDSGGPGVVYSGDSYVQVSIASYVAVPCGSGPAGNIRVDKYLGWMLARGVPFITRAGSPPGFVCNRRLDPEDPNSNSLGVVDMEVRCQVEYHAIEDVTKVTWKWGDGTTSEGIDATHVYDRAGNFSIQMCATTQLGETSNTHCVDRAGIITACDVPAAGFEIEPIEGLTWQIVNRTDVSTYGCITNLVWEVYDEDGNLWREYGGWEPEIEFDEPGDYRIVQNVGGFAGQDAAELTVQVRRAVGSCNSLGGTTGFGAEKNT